MIRQINEKDVQKTALLIKELSSLPNIVVDMYMLKAKINEINRIENVRLFGFEEEDKIVVWLLWELCKELPIIVDHLQLLKMLKFDLHSEIEE